MYKNRHSRLSFDSSFISERTRTCVGLTRPSSVLMFVKDIEKRMFCCINSSQFIFITIPLDDGLLRPKHVVSSEIKELSNLRGYCRLLYFCSLCHNWRLLCKTVTNSSVDRCSYITRISSVECLAVTRGTGLEPRRGHRLPTLFGGVSKPLQESVVNSTLNWATADVLPRSF